MENYSVLGRIGEGAHGVVLKAESKTTADVVALKKIPLKKVQDGIPLATIREIKALQHINHKNVVRLLDTFAHGSCVTLVFEYMPSDLSTLLRDPEVNLEIPHIKSYLSMLLKGIQYCHDIGIIHRDLKPANLLISWTGCLKIADFGLARLYDNTDDREYSHEVVTRWYRAPELLYGARKYDVGVDLWAIGCLLGEMLNKYPLFNGENDIEQLCLILRTLGTPTEDSYPGLSELPDYNKISFPTYPPIPMEELVPDASETARDLLSQFLVFSPLKRIRADKALVHPYFFVEPLPCAQHELPKPQESKHGFSQNISADELDITEPLATLCTISGHSQPSL